jgi:chromosomal replication initiator protein
VPAVTERTLWEEVLLEVGRRYGRQAGGGAAESYLADAVLVDADRSEVVIAVPREFVRQRIEGKLAAAIADVFETFLGARPEVKVVVDPSLAPKTAPAGAEKPVRITVAAPERRARSSGRLSVVDMSQVAGASAPAVAAGGQDALARLGQDVALETFVVGPSNKIAFQAAERICDNPGGEASPLVVTGPAGLGKTHLLAAIARRLHEKRPRAAIRFATAEDFLNQYCAASAHRGAGMEAFRARYRKADALVLDDVHVLVGKDRTQDELCHTLEELKHAGKQVVVSSAEHPKRIEGLSPRLSGRLISGLVVAIDPPDAETRRRLVEACARKHKARLPHDVIDFVARALTRNMGDIVGAIQRLSASASIGARVDVPTARRLLADLLGPRRETPVIEIIVQVVSERCRVPLEDLRGGGRRQACARARQVAMFLARRLTDLSLAEIGRFFGREPSTVTFAEARVREGIVRDDDLHAIVEECSRMVEARR